MPSKMIGSCRFVRRVFSTMVVCVLGLNLVSPLAQATDTPRPPAGKHSPERLTASTSPWNRPQEIGTYYETAVPDTLDLAERARLGLNHIAQITIERLGCEMYYGGPFHFYNKPVLMLMANSLMACQCKFMEAAAYLRLMTGSDPQLEREAKMLAMMASCVGEEGIYWVYPSKDKPWLGAVEDGPYAHVHGQGDMMHAMIAWYQYTGNPKWKELVDRMVNGVDRLMVTHKDGYAYFPTHGVNPSGYFNSCYYKGRGWKDTEEPKDEKHGEEGSLFVHQGRIAEALADWYMLTGNEQALRMAGEFVRFYMQPRFWADREQGDYPGVIGAEHAHWQGHIHGYLGILQGIMAYAQATNDARLKAFVRDGYEWTRQAAFARIGLVGDGQGCGCARMIKLAVMLTEAGVGDYWEDVDLYIRNQGTEMQLMPEDIPYMIKWGEGKPEVPPGPPHTTETYGLGAYVTEGVAEASVGGFAGSVQKNTWWACCSPWGLMGFYFAWDAALRCEDGVAKVNLLLNRASPWMDVDSHIPYEGKVALRNKQAREVFVRMPLYVEPETVRCRIGRREARPEWFGRYLRLKDLKKKDVVTLEFPLKEWTEQWTSPPPSTYCLPMVEGRVRHTIRLRGNTILGLTPPLQWVSTERGPSCWLYQGRGERFQTARAPLRQVTRYVTGQKLQWSPVK